MASLFRKLSPALARLQTLAHRHLDGAAFEAGGQGWTAEPPGAPAAAHGLAIYGKLGAGEFALWLDEPDWALAAASVLEVPPAAAAAFPDPLLAAALECFAADLLALAEKGTGLPAAVERLERGPAAPLASACRFRLRRGDGLRLGGAWSMAGGDAGWLGALEKALAGIPLKPPPLPEDLPVEGIVGIGLWRAPAGVLAELAPGDVALSPAGPERFLTVGRALRFAARLEKGVLLVEGKTMTREVPAPAPAAAGAAAGVAGVGAAAGAANPLDAVEVELLAQVGRLTLTLAQLRQLGAGQVVEFSTPVESPATLLVGGRAVASGELVDVGGRVGVRITSLAER